MAKPRHLRNEPFLRQMNLFGESEGKGKDFICMIILKRV
jgi:hypothetical protein